MKSILSTLLFALVCSLSGLVAQNGYEIGDVATDFELKDVDGDMVSLSDYPDANGYIVIFTCNHCPFAQQYEDRIIQLHKDFAPQGYPVIAINPNDPDVVPADSYENMQQRAEEKGFPFPYVLDEGQEIYPQYGAERTPHVFLLDSKREVKYIGAIDDNYKDADAVEEQYVRSAIKSLQEGNTPDPQATKAIGCTIKTE